MRRSVRRVLSLCLVLSLTLALCIPAFAAGNVCFEDYLMIGDSIGVYCGDPPKEKYIPVYSNAGMAFPGTYSELLKNDGELGIQRICSCAHPGWRVQDALYALGGENRTSDYMLAFAGDTLDRIQTMRSSFTQGLEDAELISINLGNNNIFQPFIYGLYTAFEKESISFEGSCCDKAALDSLKRLQADCSDFEAFADLLGALESMERGTVLLKNVLKMLPDSLADYQRSWDDLIRLITTANPDAKILVLGLYNPVEYLINDLAGKNLPLSSGGKSLVGGAAKLLNDTLDPVIRAYNNYLRSGCRYAGKYVYVDVTGVKLDGSKDGLHLGDLGHKYVYGQMKNAIMTHFVSDAIPAKKLTLPGLLGKVASAVKFIFTWR